MFPVLVKNSMIVSGVKNMVSSIIMENRGIYYIFLFLCLF